MTYKKKNFQIRSYILLLLVCWTGAIIILGYWNSSRIRQTTKEIVLNNANALLQQHAVVKNWVANHGICLPVASEKQVSTPNKAGTTAMADASIIRQTNETFKDLHCVSFSHLISLRPLKDNNKPDAWEERALKQLVNGSREVTSFTQLDQKPFFRMVRPLYVKDSCLDCHKEQGYISGETLGACPRTSPLNV